MRCSSKTSQVCLPLGGGSSICAMLIERSLSPQRPPQSAQPAAQYTATEAAPPTWNDPVGCKRMVGEKTATSCNRHRRHRSQSHKRRSRAAQCIPTEVPLLNLVEPAERDRRAGKKKVLNFRGFFELVSGVVETWRFLELGAET